MVVLCLGGYNAGAQNMVLNPGFEDTLKCPSGSGAFTTFVAVWDKPTFASSDYFYTGCPVAPTNEPPHGGNAYAGLIVYDPANYREYITGTLSAPLLAGETYEVSFYVSLLDNCVNGITELGAWLTNTAPTAPGIAPILVTPQVKQQSPIIQKSGWVQVIGYYQAAGGESYITLGSFVPDSIMTFTPAPPPNNWGDVYYFIDDVFVGRDSVTGVALHEPEELRVYPNPASGQVSFETGGMQGVLVITDVPGHEVVRRRVNGFPVTISCAGLADGLYFYHLLPRDGGIRTGRFMVRNR